MSAGDFWLPLIVASAASFSLTPVIRAMALRAGIVDTPVARSVHAAPVPSLGGIAVYAAFVLASVAAFGPRWPELWGMWLGGLVVLGIGIADDLLKVRPHGEVTGLPAWAKFLGQVAGAAIAYGFGVRIEWVTRPFGGFLQVPGWFGFPLTVFWIVAVTNIVNHVDGLDGLASGVASIASLSLLPVALDMGQYAIAALAAAAAGAALGFLPHNFPRARIFLGDTGALFLGYIIGAVAVEGALKSTATIGLAVPILALGFPIVDTASVVMRRIANGRPFYVADTDHLHHRMLAAGLTQIQVVVALYAVSALLGVTAVVAARVAGRDTIALTLAVLGGLVALAHRAGLLSVKRRGVGR